MIVGNDLITLPVWVPEYLIRDEFLDNHPAGTVNNTAATPGPGTRTVTDTESKLSVGGGVLTISGGKASRSWGDPEIGYGALSRAAGLSVITKINSVSISTYVQVGWDDSVASGELTGHAIYFNDLGSRLSIRNNVTQNTINLGDYSTATIYICAVIQRGNGAFFCIQGGDYTKWTILWTSRQGAGDYIPAIANYSATITGDYIRVTQLPAPFDSDDGLATDTHSGSVASGTTFVHEADCLIEFTATTLPSSGYVTFFFRAENFSSDFWYLYYEDNGYISLVEKTANTTIVRGSCVAGSISAGDRVVIVCDNESIKVYVDNSLLMSYASASSHKNETDGRVNTLQNGAVISDLKTWPRTLSGRAKQILDIASQ